MSKINKIKQLLQSLLNISKDLVLNTLDFLGLLSPNHQLSTDTALLVAVVIKFLTVPSPNFADIPAIIALIASRVHKRQVITKNNKTQLEQQVNELKTISSKQGNVIKELNKEVEVLNSQMDRKHSKSKTDVWNS